MIKKLLLLSIIISSTCLTVLGQKNQKFTLGFKTGLNRSVFTKDVNGLGTGSNNYDRYFRISSLIGLILDFNKTDRFILGTELLYNARGMAYRKENSSVIVIGNDGAKKAYTYFKYNIDYLELPLKASYNIAPEGDFNIYGGIAPSITVRSINATRYPKVTAGPNSSSPDVIKNLKDVRSFNSSIIAGFNFIGRKFESGGGFFIDTRFSYTLLPIFTREKSVDGNNLNTKMITGTLGIGVKF